MTAPTLLLSDIFPPKTGGSGRWFWEIYRRLPRAEYLVAAGEHPGAAAFDASHDLRVTRLPLEMRNRGVRSWSSLTHYLRTARAVRRLARAEGVRMIHAARPLSEGLVARMVRMRTGTPYCCYTHGEDINIATTSRELAWLTRRVLRGATAIIANSGFTRDLLLKQWNVPPEKVRLLHPGVDCDYFHPADPDPEVRKRLEWAGRQVILTVGRLQRRKGHDVMIEVVARLRHRFPNLLYAIIGDGEERARLVELAGRLGVSECVRFLGEVKDTELLHCYQQCDLFALPNRAVGKDVEGFGMVLLEAQACGRPVLAGASGGTAETMVCDTSRETGVLVACDRANEPAAVLAELLADPERLVRMGRAGREWVEGKFNWPALAIEARQTFEALLPRNPRDPK
ncbi:glycosyltransferase family 4 protein [Frigoriglobus tundricola]|uniref:GT4 family glycosyltransferase n=1 Tax=Frigoriglobus tundricola TaxID=2774151 RepID=A0A6M5YJY0_9BACT|nr:glycosyltransferase family 4 protein [Frigoriglobus tundricola]QJW94298.1 GT4 family glycosyltransferase [Frigoriglobus tundricola]